MVHGYCVGGAFMQLLACDFAIAAENATFSLSEVNWGILPGALVSKVVSDMVLPRHALYYACLGDAFDGKEAARIGMVNFAVPPEKLEAATTELAEKLMKKSAAVLRATKQAIRHVRTMDVAQAYDYLAEKGKAIKVADKEDSYNTGPAAIPRREILQAHIRAVPARDHADRPAGRNRRRRNNDKPTGATSRVAPPSAGPYRRL